MSTRAKPARVQYYIDADLLGLAKILVQVRPDVTYPGDPGGLTRNKRLRSPCTIKEPRTAEASSHARTSATSPSLHAGNASPEADPVPAQLRRDDHGPRVLGHHFVGRAQGVQPRCHIARGHGHDRSRQAIAETTAMARRRNSAAYVS